MERKVERVEVIWRDACARHDDYDPAIDQVEAGLKQETIGYFVETKDGFMRLAEERNGNAPDTFRGTYDLPLGELVEVWELKRGRRLWPPEEKQRRGGKKCRRNTSLPIRAKGKNILQVR